MKKKEKKEIQEAELRAGIKDMSFGKKLEYFWMYDKWVLAVIIGVLAAGIGGYRWYEASKIKTMLSITAVNSILEDSEGLIEEIRGIIGAEGKYETVSLNANLVADYETGDLDYYSQVGYIAQFQSKSIDIMLMPESMAAKLNEDGVFLDLQELLGQQYPEYEEYVKYNCFNVSETEIPSSFGMAEPVYLGIVLNSPHVETAVNYLEAVLN